ncbi:hypothetical protein L3Y34_000472 [Caenorhabditis briggsae]|uniref:C3H1-type domain-containing protein n=1 Tax=Caenorhabditis briggsae TaxID=6238 RepID=A0AAE9D9J2_CAEBR|nr:hypothetical protein L3Y34_000472 [Caenorhabditis briggsae]
MFFECLILLLAVYFLLPRRRERIPRKSLKGLVRFVVEKFKDKKNCESENLAENLAENSPYCCDSCIKLIRRNLGDCPFGIGCRFLHPEDGEVYLKAVNFEKKKDAHSTKVQALHALKKLHPDGSQKALDVEEEINKTVREYNGTKPRGDHYYDLHGLTTNGAEVYVEEIVVEMKESLVERASFETGRGNHSEWNIPFIKNLLIDKYSGSNDITVYFLLPRRRERIPRKSLKGLVRFVVEKFKDKKNCESENLAENLAENSPYCCDSCIKLIRRFDRFCTIFQLGNFAIPIL